MGSGSDSSPGLLAQRINSRRIRTNYGFSEKLLLFLISSQTVPLTSSALLHRVFKLLLLLHHHHLTNIRSLVGDVIITLI